MNSLPSDLPLDGEESFTGLVCPDCAGNLVVRRDAEFMTFRCRVGHAYSLVELVTAKETTLETRLWSAVFAFEELQALLTELDAHGLAESLDSGACRDRAALAGRQAERLRAIIQDDRPLAPTSAAMGGAAGPSSP
jgi:two-component system chemotaxis response regulator CheB